MKLNLAVTTFFMAETPAPFNFFLPLSLYLMANVVVRLTLTLWLTLNSVANYSQRLPGYSMAITIRWQALYAALFIVHKEIRGNKPLLQ